MGKRVCIIGAGPSGVSLLWWLAKMKREGKEVPEVVCYEKQENWGGLWKYQWRTGVDEHGEPVHGSQYKNLWSNGPKECLEFPYYTFEDHFGKNIPSFPPREVLLDYLEGKWNKEEIRPYIRFKTVVRDVQFRKDTNDFLVSTKDLINDKIQPDEVFDYVAVATGHFSFPNYPTFEGMDKFPGRVIHSHDFRDAREFAGQRVLVIGSSYSAEDIASQCIKFGAKSAICSYRSKPMNWKWPKEVIERPLLMKMKDKTAFFKDGSSAEVDAVVLCTGYLYLYPFMREDLRLKCKRNCVYPPDLYKCTVWTKGGNNKLFYLNPMDHYYSFTMFDIVALWTAKVILGEITLPPMDQMKKDVADWLQKQDDCKSCHDEIDFQTSYIMDMIRSCGDDYPFDLDTADMFHTWEHHKKENILTFRDRSFKSKFTGKQAPLHYLPFMEAMDDSLKTFVQKTVDAAQ